MQVITETELLQRIDVFLERHEMAPTTFGRQATGEPQLIDSIRKGRSPSLKVVNKVVDFMAHVDGEADLKAKLSADPPTFGDGEEEIEFPFAQAPVNPTGASSPTSSRTNAPRPTRGANGSCPSCSEAEESLVAAPTSPTEAAE